MKLILMILLSLTTLGLQAEKGKKKTICEKRPGLTKDGRPLPKNAICSMNLAGWECLEGHVQRRKNCIRLDIPKNATLNDDKHTWSCDKGFRKYRNVCKKIKLPKNGQLTEDGHDWICKAGLVRSRHRCIKK